jgi:hypothetical protein
MNQHGVPVQQQGGGVMMHGGPGTDRSKAQQAQQACQQYMQGE